MLYYIIRYYKTMHADVVKVLWPQMLQQAYSQDTGLAQRNCRGSLSIFTSP